jgi:protein-tyrosine phosphatase
MASLSLRIHFSLAILAGSHLLAQTAVPVLQEQLHPPATVSIKHFEKIDNGVYVGSKPKSDADFAFLQSLGVKTILNANFLPWLSGCERRKAKKYGMRFLSVPMNASIIPPREKHVDKILRTMRNPGNHPIYLHCVLGRDRTSMIAALYGINYLGWTRDRALETMKRAGFKQVWYLHGLKKYFDEHSTPSPELQR